MAPITKSARASMDATTGMIAPQISGLIAGAALAACAPCYLAGADGKVYPLDATQASAEKARLIGFTPRAVNGGEPVTLFGLGTVFKYADLTLVPGALLYPSSTPGTLDTAATTSGAPPTGVAAVPQAAGGTFAAGTYYYKVTALNAAGESLASLEVNATVVLNGSVVINWNQVAGATGYRIYRGAAAGAENTYYQVGAVGTFTDTNAAGTAAAPPATSVATGDVAPIAQAITTSAIRIVRAI